MESKRLVSHSDLPLLPLEATDGEQMVDIEVDEAGGHYYIRLQGDEQARYRFHLRQAGCQLRVSGLVRAEGTASPFLATAVIHHAGESRAETLVRTLSSGQAAPRYEGLIRVEEGADGTESYLNHHSLLLGSQAHSWTLPSLEILANQVRCSHAATVRTLTELDLFYLRSRGIGRQQAEQLLIDAFLNDLPHV